MSFGQGGIYVFQLVEHYGSNGASQLIVVVFESLAIGWVFGEYTSSRNNLVCCGILLLNTYIKYSSLIINSMRNSTQFYFIRI